MSTHSSLNASSSHTGDCKGCNRSPLLSEEKMERLVWLAIKEKEPHELASADVQAERMTACMSCPSLQFGTTCKHCGCLVHIRTRLTNSFCPSPYGSQWLVSEK